MALALLPYLTPRELRVLRLIAAGCTNAQIAAELSLARHTVESYVSRLFHKFQVENRVQLVVKLIELRQRRHERFLA